MAFNKMQATSASRRKMTAAVIFLVLVMMVWQVCSMFGKAASTSKPGATGSANVAVAQTASPPPNIPPPPKPAEVAQPPLSPRETALMTLQQDTQIKYLEAVNELQMLRITKDIALINKDISAATLARVEADKKVIEMLGAPSTPPPASSAPAAPPPEVNIGQPLITYSVVSISQVQYRWGAVLSAGTELYNVNVGDVLPDKSTVVAITRDSVTLMKNGARTRLSLIPII